MKYSSTNKPLVCMQTHSTCYTSTSKDMSVKGILWHSTGANNPLLKRYVQPWDGSALKDHADNSYTNAKWLEMLGTNSNNNDWNHITRQAGLNCWIGKLADGSITTIQTMPWTYKPWGCGSGSKGSCNNGWIQFEICEDGLLDKDYFNKAYKEACELTAYLCELYNINPTGTVTHNGIKVPTILCHQDSYKLGLGSNHGDIYHWFKHHGKTMDSVRNDVAAILKGADPVVIRGLSLKDTTVTSAVISFETNESFNKYSWTYNITDLKTAKTLSNNKFSVKNTSTELIIKNLKPNSAYSIELVAKDELENIIKAPGFIFSTQQECPSVAKNAAFDLSTKKFTFVAPSHWGAYSGRSRGYRISVFVNGYEKTYSDSLVSYNNGAKNLTVDVSGLLKKVLIQQGDTLQIGINPWVKDEQNKPIFAQAGASISEPVYTGTKQPLIDKIFLRLNDKYTRAIFYSNIK